ncbi:MAG: FmdB family transcriptional regulator [Chloroflexi bacterium]|jgi:putative FmdB family regulatory protein|nr:FmdB family transcriptional regulator [Chloroflexota bacterium]
MPIYEYACTVCEHGFERLRPISRMDDEAPCPKCDSESKRQLSVFAAFTSTGDGEYAPVGGGGGCAGCGPNGCGCAGGM